MAIKNIPSGIESTLFLQQHSAQLRIWHWLIFLFISASIVTVFLNSTLLSPRENVKLVQDQLQRKGIAVSVEQAFAVSHEYEDKMWELHKFIGFGIAFLLLARVAIEFTQPEDEKLTNRLKKVQELRATDDLNRAKYNHYLKVKMGYSLFFLLLFCMTLTGLGLAFGRDLGFSRGIHEVIKNVHAIIQFLLYAFIVVHLAGVILAENGKIKGIVSGMIHGNKS